MRANVWRERDCVCAELCWSQAADFFIFGSFFGAHSELFRAYRNYMQFFRLLSRSLALFSSLSHPFNFSLLQPDLTCIIWLGEQSQTCIDLVCVYFSVSLLFVHFAWANFYLIVSSSFLICVCNFSNLLLLLLLVMQMLNEWSTIKTKEEQNEQKIV